MKKTKILIFGKNSFIGSSLYSKLKSHFTVNIANYKIQKLNKIKNYDFIINCSTNKNYTKIKYLQKNDFDLQIAKKIKKEKTHLIFLSSRKVYRPGPNLNENSKIECKKHYERNKYISEKAISKIKKSNLTILRISNLIGYKKKGKRSIHNTYLDTLLKEVRNGKNINNNNAYKDFLDIKTFSKIIYLIIKNKVNGIFNVSIGKKIYLNDINSWILYYYKKKKSLRIITSKFKDQDHSFYLNNNKLKKNLKINIRLNTLKNECYKLSKKLFC